MLLLALPMEPRRICSAFGCYTTHRQKELKFFSFPMDLAWYVFFNSYCDGFMMCCLIVVASINIVII
jgi:hypothetical protein